jgi:hypothetical protein
MTDDELTLGGPAINWSQPSPTYNPETGQYESNGWVFFGLEPVTEEDIQALVDLINPEGLLDFMYSTDEASLVGRHHRDWSSNFYATVEPHQRPGGLGSPTYERQLVGAGVQFAKEPIWHYNTDGQFVKEIPADMGAYHTYIWPDGYSDNIAGPEKGSEAETLLDGGSYGWDEEAQYYIIQS